MVIRLANPHVQQAQPNHDRGAQHHRIVHVPRRIRRTWPGHVDDRANANFLWFIKFERSFQERERKMVEDSVRLSAEVVDLANWAKHARKSRRREDCA